MTSSSELLPQEVPELCHLPFSWLVLPHLWVPTHLNLEVILTPERHPAIPVMGSSGSPVPSHHNLVKSQLAHTSQKAMTLTSDLALQGLLTENLN